MCTPRHSQLLAISSQLEAMDLCTPYSRPNDATPYSRASDVSTPSTFRHSSGTSKPRAVRGKILKSVRFFIDQSPEKLDTTDQSSENVVSLAGLSPEKSVSLVREIVSCDIQSLPIDELILENKPQLSPEKGAGPFLPEFRKETGSFWVTWPHPIRGFSSTYLV